MTLFLSLLWMRTKRVLLCSKKSIVPSLAVTSAVTFVYLLSQIIIGSYSEIPVKKLLGIITVCFAAAFYITLAVKTARYKGAVFHRFDENIVDDAFTGMNKKSAVFEKGMEILADGYYGSALEVFVEIDEDTLSVKEKAVLDFYKARCYDSMDWKPNAIICYNKAAENGLDIPELNIFLARCYSENGNMEKALEICTSLMDKNEKYSHRMRYEIGRMYLKLNEGAEALRWFNESIEKHECYADSLGGAAVAYTLLGKIKDGEEYYKKALLNGIANPESFTNYYKSIQAAIMLESHMS